MSDVIDLGEWNGRVIRVSLGEEAYVNVTEMGKAEGKLWGHYWQNKDAQAFAEAVALDIGIPISKLIYTTRGRGDVVQQGTWAHRLIAIDFARWLSPIRAVWMAKRIDEILRTGHSHYHREHQEAAFEGTAAIKLLTQMVDKQDRTLDELKYQRWENMQTLRALQQASPERLEKVVEDELLKAEGGRRQVRIASGCIIDVLTESEAVEIKHWKNTDKAHGQITRYRPFLDAEYDPRVHLFWKPLDRPPSDKQRSEIERRFRLDGIRVTWHEWQEPERERQKQLPLSFGGIVDASVTE